MNAYKCFWNKKEFVFHAATSLQAQQKATIHWKVKRPWEISTVLIKKCSEDVLVSTSSI